MRLFISLLAYKSLMEVGDQTDGTSEPSLPTRANPSTSYQPLLISASASSSSTYDEIQ